MGRLQYSLFKAQLQSGDPNGRNVKVSPRSCLFAQRRKLQFPFAIFSQIAQQVSLRARCIRKESPQVPTLLKSKKKPPSCQVLQENRNSFAVILAKADTLKQLAGPVYLKGDSQHAFLELLQKVYSAKSLCGTIYLEGQAKHQYNELQKQADKIKSLSEESKHSSGEIYKQVESLKALLARSSLCL